MKVTYTLRALRGLYRAEQYTERVWGEEQAEMLRMLVKQAEQQIEQFPLSGTLYESQDVRVVKVLHTPFVLAYRVQSETVEVVTCFHSAQQWPE